MSDPQSQWAELLLESLVAAGVRSAVISPGSRSTPLVWAATRTRELACHCLIDERSAGFYALGQARVSGLPSLLICTSGSALSNYFPAVIEARESGTPLIVLSADRPFELQHSGAHQTIDQTRLFGTYAHYHDLGTPVAELDSLLALRRTAWQAVQRSLDAPRGAVHLNFRAKKPLEPRDTPRSVELPAPAARAPLARPRRMAPGDADLATLLGLLERSQCPLLICGAASPEDAPSAELVGRYAELTGSVVCPESVSQLRFRLDAVGAGGLVCDSYDWLLGNAALGAQLDPDFVLQIGGTPVSAVLERLLSNRVRPLPFAICAESGWPDPLHHSAEVLRAAPSELLEAVCVALNHRERAPRPRLALWRDAQASARGVLDRHLAEAAWGEAQAVAEVCAALPRGSLLAVGNSLPPRLLDRYVRSGDRQLCICCQRGASGIEGAIAGAFGAASQTRKPVTLLLGDISFLHDIGSLWAASPARICASNARPPLAIVVLNNGGGRIFEQLPIASQPGVALEFWTTPHQLRLRAAAELYGVAYAEVKAREPLRAALESAYAGSGVSLIEVVVEPDNAARTQRSVSAELDPRLSELASRRGACAD